MSMTALVERLTMGSGAGASGSRLASLSVSGVSATGMNPPLSLSLQTLNQGVTQMYLMVDARRSMSFTGKSQSTEMAKNWKVRYWRMEVRASSFFSNSPEREAQFQNALKDLKSDRSSPLRSISQWKKSPPTRKMAPTTIAPK